MIHARISPYGDFQSDPSQIPASKGGAKGSAPAAPHPLQGRASDKPPIVGGMKSRLCKFWMEEWSCQKGDKCTYAHGSEELCFNNRGGKGKDGKDYDGYGYKTRLCSFFEEHGCCLKGAACSFAHSELDLEVPQQGMLDPAEKGVSKGAGSFNPAVKGSGKMPQSGGGFKMALCKFFTQTGMCQKGETCNYAHGEHELQTPGIKGGMKFKLCPFYEQGTCTKGAACSFAHGAHEVQAEPLHFPRSNGILGPDPKTLAVELLAAAEAEAAAGAPVNDGVMDQMAALMAQMEK